MTTTIYYRQIDTVPRAYEEIDVGAVAVALDPALVNHPSYGAAREVLFYVKSGPISWRTEGGDPTAAIGNVWYESDYFVLSGELTLQRFKAIRISTSTSGKLCATYCY
jgi:hypothetical protein